MKSAQRNKYFKAGGVAAVFKSSEGRPMRAGQYINIHALVNIRFKDLSRTFQLLLSPVQHV